MGDLEVWAIWRSACRRIRKLTFWNFASIGLQTPLRSHAGAGCSKRSTPRCQQNHRGISGRAPARKPRFRPLAACRFPFFPRGRKVVPPSTPALSYRHVRTNLNSMGNQPSQPKITAQDRAILQLKKQRDSLKQYQRKLAGVVDRQTSLAKQALQDGNPEKAKLYLRLKKRQQSVISSSYEQLNTLEGLIGTIEFKLIEKDVLYGLQQGNEVLKKLNSEMSVEKIDRVLDDLEEERVKVDEVSDALGSGLTNLEEAEVDDEFEALEREYGKQKTPTQPEEAVSGKAAELPDVPKVPTMPEVPREDTLSEVQESGGDKAAIAE